MMNVSFSVNTVNYFFDILAVYDGKQNFSWHIKLALLHLLPKRPYHGTEFLKVLAYSNYSVHTNTSCDLVSTVSASKVQVS